MTHHEEYSPQKISHPSEGSLPVSHWELRPGHEGKFAQALRSWEEELQQTEKVTEKEIEMMRELDLEIQSIESYMPNNNKDKISWATDSFNKLCEERPAWGRDRAILALSIAAMKHPPILRFKRYPELTGDLTPSQKLLVVRLQNALESGDQNGLIALMRAGEGKSFAIPAVLPLMLSYFKHVDVTSLSPVKRQESFKAFKPVALTLGITHCEYSSEGTRVADPRLGADANRTENDPNGLLAVLGLNKFRVTFALRGDIIHFFERHPEHLLTLSPDECATIKDEIDASDVDMALERYIISGKDEPRERVIRRYWNVFDLPKELTRPIKHSKGKPVYEGVISTSLLDRPTKRQWKAHCTTIKHMLQHQKHHSITDMQAAGVMLGNADSQSNDMWAMGLLRVFMRSYREISLVHGMNSLSKSEYIAPDGSLTTKGEQEVFDRMYRYFTKTPKTDDPIPPDWDWTLRALFPVQVLQATTIALSLDEQYYVENEHIKVKDKHTGYPRPRNEFTPLVDMALYAKESFNHSLKFPKTLHETVDSMTSTELHQLRYGFSLGLTGTGRSVSRFFDASEQIPSTIIPSTHEDRLQIDPIRGFLTRDEKFSWILSQLNDEWGSNAVTIIAQTQDDTDDLYEYIAKNIPSTRIIQRLGADSAETASTVIASAGIKNTITISNGMIGREVSIPVDSSLIVVSLSPAEHARNAEQESRRAARFDKPGRYVELTDPRDPIWRGMTGDDNRIMDLLFPVTKSNLRKAITTHDTVGLESMIDQIRQSNERELLRQATLLKWSTSSRVYMRRSLAALTPKQRENMRAIWPSLMTTLDVANIHMHVANTHLDTELLYGKYSSEAKRLFDQLVRKSKKPGFYQAAYRSMGAFIQQLPHTLESAPMPDPIPTPVRKWFGSFNAIPKSPRDTNS